MAELKNITKKYGNNTVLENFSIKLEEGSKTAVMGESGKGKTTLLRIIAGLEKADSGEVNITGEKIACMFQEHRLLPWKSAIDNVRSPLPKNAYHLAEKYFSKVGLNRETDGEKAPRELSGGMCQRVAFARFLAYAEYINATLLLLDEPFSALDSDTAKKMTRLLFEFSKDKTLLTVTHSENDAKALEANIIYV